MNMPTVFPVRGNHSVKNVAFVCELATNMAAPDLERLIAFYENTSRLKEFFPIKLEQRGGFSIQLQGQQPGPPAISATSPLVGLSFSRMAPDGSADWTLTVQPNAIVMACNRYERWNPALETALPILIDFLRLSPQIAIGVVGLQYLDEWTFVGAKEEPAGPLLFAPGAGGYLSARLMSEVGSWHSHSGWFDRGLADADRILVNVNVAVTLDEATHRFTTTVAHVQRAFCQPPMSTARDIEALRADMVVQFNALHANNKKLLGQMLTPEAQAQISLFPA